jgi:hypothetical protein
MSVSFIPSQRGSTTRTSLPYTANPWKLLVADIILCSSKWKFLFGIIRPWKLGSKEDSFDELYPSRVNIISVFLHSILLVAQSLFLVSLPLFLIIPIPLSWFLLYLAGVWGFHSFICFFLNGTTTTLEPSKHIVPKYNHDSEYWIYLNGVSVGKDWLQSNIDRLSMTFGRRVHGVLNPTDGIIFDLIQCLVQRNLQYATSDIREAYISVKKALYDENIKKVVFIQHSQGAIEGGLIIDWLLAEGMFHPIFP